MSRTFPKGFLWGTSSAAYQVEGDNRNCDWWEWEQQPGRIDGGDTSAVACDHYHRYREDFALLRELNQNAHRLSIEWSRIEPSEGEFDSRQLRHYRDVLGELRAADHLDGHPAPLHKSALVRAQGGLDLAGRTARIHVLRASRHRRARRPRRHVVHHQRAQHLWRERLDHGRLSPWAPR